MKKRIRNIGPKFPIRFWAIALLTIVGCQKIVDVPAPPKNINSGNIFLSDATAIGAMNGIYRNGIDFIGLPLNAPLLCDEIKMYDATKNTVQLPYYKNAFLETSSTPWTTIYTNLFNINSAIEGLNASSTLTPKVKNQLLGEAKFMRAFNFFYAVNLFGGVPLALTSDYETNRLLHRASVSEVYEVIIKDLSEAQTLLSKTFVGGNILSTSTERVRPTSWAATALLARVYLYKGDFSKAIEKSSEVIDNSSLFTLPALNNVFLKNSTETIWAIDPLPNVFFTSAGGTFILPSSGPSQSDVNFYLQNNLLNSFEQGDSRKNNWIGSVTANNTIYYFPYKYKATRSATTVTEYEIILRLAEQYLIRAEARARINISDFAGAISDLNIIRTRARATVTAAIPNPLPNLPINLNQSQILAAIDHERQTELFTEWAHRWFDLKRMPGIIDPTISRADEVMPSVTQSKGGTWSPNWKLLPIPREQRLKDPNMLNEQNPGY